MKTRTGFVSNSSTTSFTVVLHPHGESLTYKLFDLVTAVFGKSAEMTRTEVGELRQDLLRDQKDLHRDINFIEDALVQLASYRQDPKLVAAVKEVLDFQDGIIRARQARHERLHQPQRARDTWVQQTQRDLEHSLREAKRDLQLAEGKLGKLNGVPDSALVITWKESHHASGLLGEALPKLIDEGLLTILEKTTT